MSYTRAVRRAVVPLFALIAGCGDNGGDKTGACHLAETQANVQVQDRKIIGLAAPYDADLGLAARDEELRTSIAARRAAAWQVVERVLHPVPLGDPKLAQNFGGTQPVIPAWHTWYARDDFERTFKKLYRDLGPAGRAVRAPIDAAAGFAWNANALDELPEWPEQRYLDYLAAIDTSEEVDGVGNASRVGYSPGALTHLIQSYAKEYACRLAPAPDPFAPDAMRAGQMITQTEKLALDDCGWQVLGPFEAGNAAVTVRSHGDGDADLYVRRGAAPTTDAYDCRSQGDSSDESCTVDGGGPVYVAVFAADPSAVSVDISYLGEDVTDPSCLDGAMPRDAVIVKADWRRQLGGDLLPVFDTSGPRMAARLAPGGDAAWNADGAADPTPAQIYTSTLSTGQTFRLAGLHMMSKELDHWMWITLWWSPDPDTDFGADRPAAISALPGPWKNYKMCVSSSYLDGDPDPRGGQPGSLGDALAAVHPAADMPSWCSNPYVELGKGNAATNCIGCHQHGGTDLTPEHILADEPHHGTTRVRNNFFTDYSWAIKGGGGEDLSSTIQAEIEYWDAND